MFSRSGVLVVVVGMAAGMLVALCGCGSDRASVPDEYYYRAPRQEIMVDGGTADWAGIEGKRIAGADKLWIGDELGAEEWEGNEDLSVTWKAAWFGQKVYFLFDVTDDNLQQCKREFTWLNDCIEIQFDPTNREGERLEGVKKETPLEGRLGRKLYGYELHFLPCDPPKVYLDDTQAVYRTENEQTEMFYREWDGEIRTRPTATGYVVELGFDVPKVTLERGTVMGVEVAIGDDDGDSRESLMVWTGYQGPFWITMDHYGKVELVENQ